MNALFLTVLLAATSAFANPSDSCSDDRGSDLFNQPKVFQLIISQKETCAEAASLAFACAWGTSLDVGTAATASDVCRRELNTKIPSLGTVVQIRRTELQCDSEFVNVKTSGTLGLSINAYCKLNAVIDAITETENSK